MTDILLSMLLLFLLWSWGASSSHTNTVKNMSALGLTRSHMNSSRIFRNTRLVWMLLTFNSPNKDKLQFPRTIIMWRHTLMWRRTEFRVLLWPLTSENVCINKSPSELKSAAKVAACIEAVFHCGNIHSTSTEPCICGDMASAPFVFALE